MNLELYAGPLLAMLLGYALGSIPFGLLLTRAGGTQDLRQLGSGNIGATNVLRTGRKELAALTLLLDAAKGAAAVLIAAHFFPGEENVAAVSALLGHLYPVWLRFRGGKGVATFLGIALGLHWPIGLIYAAVWIAVLLVSRYSSLAGMTAGFLSPVAAAFFGRFDLVLLFLGFALLVFWKHRANVERLLAGEEPRVGRSRDG